MSHSSSTTFKCSYVHPPGPCEDPRGALFKLVRNVALSNSTGTSGSNSDTFCVNGLTTCWERLSCIARKVSSFPWASAAPVRYCRALDTSSRRTF